MLQPCLTGEVESYRILMYGNTNTDRASNHTSMESVRLALHFLKESCAWDAWTMHVLLLPCYACIVTFITFQVCYKPYWVHAMCIVKTGNIKGLLITTVMSALLILYPKYAILIDMKLLLGWLLCTIGARKVCTLTRL